MAKLALKEALKKRKISARKFAALIQIDYKNVSRLYREGSDPRLSTLCKWAKVIGCKVRDLIKE